MHYPVALLYKQAFIQVRHLMRVSTAANGSVVQQSKARWNVTLQSAGALVVLAARSNLTMVSVSILPSSRRAWGTAQQAATKDRMSNPLLAALY